jgi:hypothetical protein
MTKHKQEKLDSAYMPEAEEETLEVMSGFCKVRFFVDFCISNILFTHL